jgi:hypothetical protein
MTQDPGENDNEYRSKAWVGKSYAIKHRGRDWHRTQDRFPMPLERSWRIQMKSKMKVELRLALVVENGVQR